MRNTLPKGLIVPIALILVGVGIGISAGLFAAGAGSQVPHEKIVIAIQPTETASEIASRATQLEEFLESRVDADVEIYIPMTYSAVIEAIRFGNADVAFMSAWPSYLASKLAGAEVVLAEVREVVIGQEKRNEPYYFSYWIVPRNSPYDNLAELKGKRSCFPNPISTSGYVFPVGKLVELGLISKPTSGEADPRTFFGEVIFAGGYGQCWAALKSGQVDVTIMAGDVSEKLYREVIDNTKILEKQGPIPSHSIVFSRDFKEPLRSRLTSALIDLGTPEHRGMMRKFISGTFVNFRSTSASEHLSDLQRALELTGFKFSEKLG